MQQRGNRASVTIVNGVMYPVARQLQHLQYNNGNGDIFYEVRVEESFLEDNWCDHCQKQLLERALEDTAGWRRLSL
jgi:hypothetical protein